MTIPLFELVYTIGGTEQRLPLSNGSSLLVGRESDCEMSLPDETKASRQHCRIWCEGGVVRLRDLDSSNGTRLGGVRVTEVVEWHTGQPVEIGATRVDLLLPGTLAGNGLPWSLRRLDNDDQIPLIRHTTTVGRLPECDWTLDEKGISAGHARLQAAEDKLTVEDLGSSNGSFVNGQRLSANTPTALMPHAELRLGNIRFRVQCEGAAPAPDAGTKVIKPDQSLTPFILDGQSDPINERSFPLRSGATIVGRAPGTDWVIDDKSVSQEHARLEASIDPPALEVVDLGSSNGTYVDGQRLVAQRPTPLRHGSKLRFGAVKLTVERTDLKQAPVMRRSSAAVPSVPSDVSPIPVGTLVRAAALTAVVALAIVGASRLLRLKPANTGLGSGVISGGSSAIDPLELGSRETAILAFLRKRDYASAKAEIARAGGQVNRELVALVARHNRLFGHFRSRLEKLAADESKVQAFGMPGAQVVRTTHKLVELFVAGKGLVEIRWVDLTPAELLQAYRERRLDRQYPLDYASFLAFQGEKQAALAFLQAAFHNESFTRDHLNLMLAELHWRPSPELFERKPVSGSGSGSQTASGSGSGSETAPGSGSGSGSGSELKIDPPEIDRAAQRLRQLESAIRREATEIVSLGRLLRYDDAISSLERLLAESPSERITTYLKRELAILRRESTIFATVRAIINKDGIDLRRVPSLRNTGAGEDAKISAADEEFYTIRLARGELRERWRFLGVARMIEVYETLPRTPELLFARGVFAYERGQLTAASRALIAAKSKSAEISKEIDRYLAFRTGVPIPEGGFVPYNGRLVTPEELEMRRKGMVRFGDQWVTPEDKAKLEAGFVLYKGKWVKAGDAELLKQGFIKYEGKWHKKADLNKIRSAWERAWEVETAHVQLRSNMDIDFVEELLARLEGAYHRYHRYWGKKPDTALRFFAFRTFEDYQKYCIDNKYNNLLGAAGFALAHKNICVGYNKGGSVSSFLSTMVHEGSHLFYGRVHRAQYPSWYAEAMSTFHESHKWKDATRKELLTGVWNRSRFFGLKRTIRDGSFIPYGELMVTNALTSINTSRSRASAFYCQAWALYYFFEKGTKDEALQKKWEAFRRSVDGGALNANGRSLNAAAKAKFEAEVMTTAELDTAIKTFFTNPDNVPAK